MDTVVVTVDPEHPQSDRIERAAAVLRAGGLVAFPTETVYGLGANALDGAALQRIFDAKRRPTSDPIIAHIADTAQLAELAEAIPPLALELAARFWPGPLTLILRRAATVPPLIAEGMDTVAVRMPAHPVARALLAATGVPVGAPSANTFTRPSATTAAHVLEDLDGRIDMVLDGGPTTLGLESTVLDLTGEVPRVLRPGSITLDALRALVPGCELAPRYLDTEQATAAPGQLLKHYSPRAAVLLFSGDTPDAARARMRDEARAQLAAGQRVGVLVSHEEAPDYPAPIEVVALGARDDLDSVARNLFAGLRRLDALAVDVILVRDFGRTGVGAALWDRLLRAAEGRVIEARA